jgi:hypothetical protein
MIHKIKYIFLLIPFLLIASTNDRALYIKKYSKESKTALIIGNANYEYFSKLKNTTNDAKDMKNLLESKGFKVHYLENATLRQMKKTLRKFAYDIKNGGVGMLYYAGHGVEVDGKNYLIPVDANIPVKDEVEYEALAVNMLIDKMENARNRLNILVLDACRNDPFSRSGSGGLAPINNAKGMFVAYATAPGEVASDGRGKNGLFTKHLINEIKKPQTLEKVFKNTRSSVLEESNDKQLPWTSSSVTGEFYFTLDTNIDKAVITTNQVITKTSKPTTPSGEEKDYWDMVKEQNKKEFYALYLKDFPDGFYVNEANIAIKKLNLMKMISSKVDQPSVKKESNTIRVAVLPIRYISNRDHTPSISNCGRRLIYDFKLRKSPRFEVVSNFCGSENKVPFPTVEDDSILWKRDGFFSNLEPNLDTILPLIKPLNVDIVYTMDITPQSYKNDTLTNGILYVIDVKNKKIYKKELEYLTSGREIDGFVIDIVDKSILK